MKFLFCRTGIEDSRQIFPCADEFVITIFHLFKAGIANAIST